VQLFQSYMNKHILRIKSSLKIRCETSLFNEIYMYVRVGQGCVFPHSHNLTYQITSRLPRTWTNT